jgi:hypothetical protein
MSPFLNIFICQTGAPAPTTSMVENYKTNKSLGLSAPNWFIMTKNTINTSIFI